MRIFNAFGNFARNSLAMMLVGAMVVFIAFSVHGRGRTYVDDLGGAGEECLPNDSCDTGYTCFNINDSHVCQMEVKPVVPPGARSCYTYTQDGQEHTPCFERENECIVSFARNTQDPKVGVIKGCAYQTN